MNKGIIQLLPIGLILIGIVVVIFSFPASGGGGGPGDIFETKYDYEGTFAMGFDITGTPLLEINSDGVRSTGSPLCPWYSTPSFSIIGAGSGKHIYVEVDGKRVQDFGKWDIGAFGTYSRDFSICLLEGTYDFEIIPIDGQGRIVQDIWGNEYTIKKKVVVG